MMPNRGPPMLQKNYLVMNDKITSMCHDFNMESPAFIHGVIMYAEMLEGHGEPDGIIISRCEALIKVWADKSEPHWDILSIVRKIA